MTDDRGHVEPLGQAEAPLGHPDLFSTVAEGGEVPAIASGWRLALREFSDNKVAVLGVAILVFFVLFCSSGRSSTTPIRPSPSR